MSKGEQTFTGKAVRSTGNALLATISQRARGHWGELLVLVLLGDHLGFWEVSALASGELSTTDLVLLVGVLGRLAAQFGPGGGQRREGD